MAGCRWPVRALAVPAALAAFMLSAPVASAAGCQSGTATFSSTGAEQCYTVPAGVSELSVAAVGGRGGNGFETPSSGVGGFGALVNGNLVVTPGATLYVEVGANGSTGGGATFGGGGSGSSADAGSGGGASDVQTVSCGTPCSPLSAASLASRLLVAGGGGGGGDHGFLSASPFIDDGGGGGSGGVDLLGGGGAGGSGANGPLGVDGGGGGGGGTLAGGGSRGAGGDGTSAEYDGSSGGAGGYGAGGAGACCTGVNGAGGGGGGYYGGGGGGTGGSDASGTNVGANAGGGAGSSYAQHFDATFATDTTGVPEVTISPLAPVISFSPATGLAWSGTQAAETIASAHTLTITNTGNWPLQISSLTFAGSDPDDFVLSSNGCLGQIAIGASCAVGVSFAPQAKGSRTATLQLASNSATSPATVPLTGTGGSPPVTTLTTCKTTTKTVTKGKGKHRHKVKVKTRKCVTKYVPV